MIFKTTLSLYYCNEVSFYHSKVILTKVCVRKFIAPQCFLCLETSKFALCNNMMFIFRKYRITGPCSLRLPMLPWKYHLCVRNPRIQEHSLLIFDPHKYVRARCTISNLLKRETLRNYRCHLYFFKAASSFDVLEGFIKSIYCRFCSCHVFFFFSVITMDITFQQFNT